MPRESVSGWKPRVGTVVMGRREPRSCPRLLADSVVPARGRRGASNCASQASIGSYLNSVKEKNGKRVPSNDCNQGWALAVTHPRDTASIVPERTDDNRCAPTRKRHAGRCCRATWGVRNRPYAPCSRHGNGLSTRISFLQLGAPSPRKGGSFAPRAHRRGPILTRVAATPRKTLPVIIRRSR